jgi:hypothetical protein
VGAGNQKRRGRNISLSLQALTDASGEGGLTCAQWAIQGKEISSHQKGTQANTKLVHLVLGGNFNH